MQEDKGDAMNEKMENLVEADGLNQDTVKVEVLNEFSPVEPIRLTAEQEKQFDAIEKFDYAKNHEFKLSRPIVIDGSEVSSLVLDFLSLTGADMEAISSAVAISGAGVAPQMAEFSKPYLMHVVARAAKVNVNYIRALPFRDVSQLTIIAQSFLMSAD